MATTKKDELIVDEMSETIISAAEELAVVHGAKNVTVSKLLNTLGITNRVFYNRFHNIDEVLETIYTRSILKIRTELTADFGSADEFFEYVMKACLHTIVRSYETKMNFNHYIFEHDSLSKSNCDWWTGQIEKVIDIAKEKGFIKNVDSRKVSYSIWCFIRGFNADAVSRGIPKEEALDYYRYTFSFLLEGMRK
ncbi:MAG: TetR/AcrR family transcriptional regulator [Ruminococcaceae bacterium]|nr:TetR/AcrR family transcriptional regulator [Oscillospiraceae bacterium]